MAQVIVIGGGLAGLSAAHTVLERGGRVCVVDKNPFYGGNSTKVCLVHSLLPNVRQRRVSTAP
jgi:succinate dehydrogenase/fumarate reductase flavoprotein subunit